MTDNKSVMQQALDVLIDSMDLVSNAHIDAVNMYSGYPALQRRITALENDVNKHKAVITALREAIAQPVPPTDPDDLTIAYMSGLADGKKAAQEKENK